MKINNLQIEQIISDSKFKEYLSLGLIDDIALRNLKIKSEYSQLRKSHSMFDAIYILADNYFLSPDSINSILFRPRNKKNILPLSSM